MEIEEQEVRDKFKCRKCSEVKSVDFFIKDRTRKRGHHPYCKACQNIIKNTKKGKERAINWNKDNPIRRAEIQKRWWNKNLGLRRLYKRQRRDRVLELCDGTVSKKSLKNIPSDFCAICKEGLKWEVKGQVHLDHIIPLIEGGPHSIGNVQWTCSTCNLKKGRKKK